jgi:hypothetical protein
MCVLSAEKGKDLFARVAPPSSWILANAPRQRFTNKLQLCRRSLLHFTT